VGSYIMTLGSCMSSTEEAYETPKDRLDTDFQVACP